jgi:hypothetical protein
METVIELRLEMSVQIETEDSEFQISTLLFATAGKLKLEQL